MASLSPHRRNLRIAALATAALALAAGCAWAQELSPLRGAVPEETITADLIGEPQASREAPATDDTAGEDLRGSPQRRAGVAPAEADDYAGRAMRSTPGEEEFAGRAGLDNERVGAIEARGGRAQDNGFEPLGLRLGTFVATVRLDQGIGWTSNAFAAPDGRNSTYSETGLRLDAVSDWSRHSASIRADGTFRRSVSGERISEVEGGVDGELRLDLGHQLSAFAGLGYRVTPESASAPSAVEGAVSRPLRHSFTGRAGIARDVGRFRASVRGDVIRSIYDDAELPDGTTVSRGDRDSTLATATLRLGYEVSPALRPFIEGEAGRRFHDNRIDSAGYERSADRYSLRAGVELDLREKLSGEIAAGWLTERPDDDRLRSISGFAAAGRLAWSPVRGTTVELSASTEVEGATSPGDAGSLLYAGSLAVSRDLRADLTGRALIGIDWRDYASSSGRDLIYRGEASLTWWMNRYAGVTGRARHELQRSNLDGRDYDATSLYLGMTLQR